MCVWSSGTTYLAAYRMSPLGCYTQHIQCYIQMLHSTHPIVTSRPPPSKPRPWTIEQNGTSTHLSDWEIRDHPLYFPFLSPLKPTFCYYSTWHLSNSSSFLHPSEFSFLIFSLHCCGSLITGLPASTCATLPSPTYLSLLIPKYSAYLYLLTLLKQHQKHLPFSAIKFKIFYGLKYKHILMWLASPLCDFLTPCAPAIHFAAPEVLALASCVSEPSSSITLGAG